jgi:hypothetical protein
LYWVEPEKNLVHLLKLTDIIAKTLIEYRRLERNFFGSRYIIAGCGSVKPIPEGIKTKVPHGRYLSYISTDSWLGTNARGNARIY